MNDWRNWFVLIVAAAIAGASSAWVNQNVLPKPAGCECKDHGGCNCADDLAAIRRLQHYETKLIRELAEHSHIGNVGEMPEDGP